MSKYIVGPSDRESIAVAEILGQAGRELNRGEFGRVKELLRDAIGMLQVAASPCDGGEARKLLVQWIDYSNTLCEACLTAVPERLHARTVGYLDASAV